MPPLDLAKKNMDLLDTHTHVGAREAREHFSQVVDQARYKKRRVIVTMHGEPVAAFVPLSDLARLNDLAKSGLSDALLSRLEPVKP